MRELMVYDNAIFLMHGRVIGISTINYVAYKRLFVPVGRRVTSCIRACIVRFTTRSVSRRETQVY